MRVIARGRYKVIRIDTAQVDASILAGMRRLVEELMNKGEKNFVLDFSGVRFMDSEVLGIVGDVYRNAASRDASIGVIIDHEELADYFDLSGLNEVMQVFADEDDLLGRRGLNVRDAAEEIIDEMGTVTVSSRGEYKIVRINGGLGTSRLIAQLSNLLHSLVSQGDTRFVFDLKGVSTVNSSILACLVNLYKSIRGPHADICVLTDNSEVRRVFDIAEITHFIRLFDNQGEFFKHIERQDEDLSLKKILVAEGVTETREAIAAQIRKLGYEIICAADGQQAVACVQEHRPDMAILDLMMPNVNGYDACRRIKASVSDRYLPVIFIADLADPREKLHALRAGGDDFLMKPFHDEDLIFRIRTHFRIQDLLHKIGRANENLELTVKQKSNSLLETERQLFQAEKLAAIGTMVSGIAHELRNPVFAISGWAQRILQKGGLTGRQERGIEFISEYAEKSMNIIDSMLSLARKKSAISSFVNFNTLVTGVVNNMDGVFSTKRIAVSTDLKALGKVKGDMTALEQVVINLLSNAVDAVNRDGTVRVRTRNSESGQIILEIEDSGVGMEESLQKRIFTPFFTTKETGRGTGLGLSIVEKIVEQHRGTISVRSAAGAGSTFTVMLPVSR